MARRVKTFPKDRTDDELFAVARELARVEGYRIVGFPVVSSDRTHVRCLLVALVGEPKGLGSFTATYSAERINPKLR